MSLQLTELQKRLQWMIDRNKETSAGWAKEFAIRYIEDVSLLLNLLLQKEINNGTSNAVYKRPTDPSDSGGKGRSK